MRTVPSRLTARLFVPVDIASLAMFRVAFGGLMALEIVWLFRDGWIDRHCIKPGFHFTYPGFGWVEPWPGNGMHWHFAALGVLAALIAVGFFHRLSSLLFCLGFTYAFLIDKTNYLNHFYLICLLSFLLIFLPANGAWSVDAALRPELRRDRTPA